MRKTLIAAAALARMASANPMPQQFDLGAILAAPTLSVIGAPVGASGQSTIAYNTASAASSISTAVTSAATASVTGASASAAATESPSNQKRAACDAEQAGSGPKVYPDTAAAFSKSPYFHALANGAPPFYGAYQQVFRDLNGSTQSNSYLTYYVLPSYNVSQCAANCDAVSLCTAFNIYVERDPSVTPGQACPNPGSTTNYKCALWGSSISAASATNTGQYREQFQVVIAGSDGYDKSNSSSPPLTLGSGSGSFTFSANLGNSAISLGGSYALGSQFYPGPFDPALCATYASAQTAVNRATALATGQKAYTPVNMFNAYFVYRNAVAWGTYCAIFDTPLDASWATFTGTVSGGFSYTVGSSYTYTLTTQDSGTF